MTKINKKRWLTALKTILTAFALTVAGGAGALFYLDTASGHKYLVQWLNDQKSEENYVLIEDFTGSLFNKPKLGNISFADTKGIWLEVHSVAVEWSLINLLLGELDITALAADSIVLHRLPTSSPHPSESTEVNLILPELPIDLSIDTFTVNTLTLEASVFGMRAHFAGNGALKYAESETLKLTADLLGQGRFNDKFSLDINFTQSDQLLKVDAEMIAPKGGLIGYAIGFEENYGLEARFSGKGPVSDWHADFSTTIETKPVLQADIVLRSGALWMNAKLDGGDFIPDESAAFFGRQAELKAQVLPTDQAHIREISASLSAETLNVRASGKISTINVAAPEAISYSLEVLDTVAINQALQPVSLLPFKVDGQITRPTGNLTATGLVERIGVKYADGLTADVSGQFSAKLSSKGVDVSSSGAVTNLVGSLVEPASGLLENELNWRIDASSSSKDRNITLNYATLGNNSLSLEADGVLSLAARRSSIKLQSSISNLSKVAETTSGEVRIDAQISQQDGAWEAESSASLTNLSTGNPVLDDLVGIQSDLTANVQFAEDGIIQINSLAMEGDHFNATGSGTIAGNRFLAATKIDVKLSNLSEMETLGRNKLSGSMDVSAELSGLLQAPDIVVTSRLNSLDLQYMTLQKLSLRADFSSALSAPSANISLVGDSSIGQLEAAAEVHITESHSINVETFFLSLGPYQTNGQAQLAQNSPIIGTLAIKTTENDQRNKPFGVLEGTVRLENHSGSQHLSTDLKTYGIQAQLSEFDVVTVQNAQLSGGLLLDDTPQIDLGLTVDGISHPQFEAEKLEISLGNTLDDIAYRIRAANTQFDPFDIDIHGNFERQENALKTTVSVSGGIRDLPLSSKTPIEMHYKSGAQGEFVVRPFDLVLGDGQMTGYLKNNLHGFETSATFENANLDTVRQFMPAMPVSGIVDGSVNFSGRGKEMSGDFNFNLTHLKAEDGFTALDEGLEMKVRGGLQFDTLSVVISAQQSDQLIACVTADLPLNVNVPDWTAAVADEQPIKGQASLIGAIGVIWPIFGTVGHDFSGEAIAAIRLSGTAAKPILEGSADVKDGRYENALTGFVAEEMELSAIIQDRKLTLNSFRATDGDDGAIRLDGSAVVADDFSLSVNANLKLEEAQLIRKPKVSLTATTNLSINKGADASSLSGSIVIDRANIGAITGTQSTIPTLDVREINGVAVDNAVGEALASKDSAIGLDLDLLAPGKLFIRSYGLDSEWSSNLKVSGSSEAPNVLGTAELVKGTFDFSGKRFDLTSGSLGFEGSDTSNPIINLRAEHSLADMTAILRITGRASAPKLEVTSVPSFPQDEILARVFFGTSVASLSPLEAVQLASTVHSLTSGGGQGLVGGVRRSLGIDRLALNQADDRDIGTTITGGKYLTNNIYVEVTTAPATGETATAIEVGLTKNLSLITRRTLDHDNNLAVRWSWNY